MSKRVLFVFAACFAATAAAYAQDASLPVNCSERDPRVNAICYDDALLTQAKTLELKYLSAMANITPVNWSELGGKWLRWRGKYIECGLYIGNRPEVAACVEKAMVTLGADLNTSPSHRDRQAAIDAATARMGAVEADAKMRRVACIKLKAAALDDGVSSARDIAVVVVKECRPETSQLVNIMALNIEALPLFSAKSGVSIEAISEVTTQMSNPDDLIGMILEVRAAKRAKRPAAAPKPKMVEG